MKRQICIFLLGALALVLAGCGSTDNSTAQSLESLAAYPETMHLNEGDSEIIQVVFTPQDAEEQGLLWTSSNRSVAVVDERGMVSALAPGSCTVTVASKSYSEISCHVEVIVNGDEEEETSSPSASQAEDYIAYLPETNASSVFPTYYLSESEVAAMDAEQIQFIINQIYAKNGYVFRTQSIQNYFSQMPWYVAVSNDTSRLSMSSLDRSNLNLLVRYRDQKGNSASDLGWIWTRHVVDGPLSASYVSSLSDYDIQLLINTIYAKNGYIFETPSLRVLFEGQPWYNGWTYDTSQLQFSDLDKENLRLLVAYR
ncbi:MAG TPA: YARHG domain-containing protein [Candidatus Evtepia faecigallinarum]|nr:YARHG domain-containing protein [Candidatus Evtepia faecigallinarum]